MSILITGGTGFIGADIVRQLLEEGGHDIHVMHRSGNFDRLGALANKVNLIQADLSDPDQLTAVVQQTKPDAIYHLGAMLSALCEQNPQAGIQANAMGTYHLLEAARKHDVRQFIFASSIATYGLDIERAERLDDALIQRPFLVYGITKLFGEQLGYFYKRKYGLDFRGLRYPSIVGPHVKTPGVVQYTSWVIEQSAQGKPFEITAAPYTVIPLMYYKEAARAMIQLGRAPVEQIKTINYLIEGPKPSPNAGQLAAIVQEKIPTAEITFTPNPTLQPLLDNFRPIDDTNARTEWGWNPSTDYAAMVDDFLLELAA